LNPNYCPETVNTDGWEHTQTAWQTLFPGIQVILCFLHTVLGIRKCCRRTPTLLQEVTSRLWCIYKAPSKRQFSQRLRRIQEWAKKHVEPETVRQKLLNLKAKSAKFQKAYDFPDAYRTSNSLDRLMNYRSPCALSYAVLPSFQKCGAFATKSDGFTVEFSSLWQQNQIQSSSSVFSLSGPEWVSVSRQLVT